MASLLQLQDFPELVFKTQVAGENKERPDLVGFDISGKELLICEAKFWAGLTENQPLGYLKRLSATENSTERALVFICPNKRVPALWGELARICGNNVSETNMTAGSYKTKVNGINMAITSWRSIIDILLQVLSAEHSPLVADLHQLQGLCDEMDEKMFIPFEPEDFGIDKARRITSFYDIVDKVADEIINKMNASSKGLKATSRRGEYIRYLGLPGYGISITYSCKYWMDKAETPFWLTIREVIDNKWTNAEQAYIKLKPIENAFPKRLFISNYQELLIPLYAPAYRYESDVVKALYDSVNEIFELYLV